MIIVVHKNVSYHQSRKLIITNVRYACCDSRKVAAERWTTNENSSVKIKSGESVKRKYKKKQEIKPKKLKVEEDLKDDFENFVFPKLEDCGIDDKGMPLFFMF